MLILTRRVGERIMIGDDVSITVLRITGSQIRLGIVAPRAMSVQREELLARIKAEGPSTLGKLDEQAPDPAALSCEPMPH